ncbi:hypothetical protein AB0C69_33815 [Actinomadura sp. NPDC048032]|uniref:hypothetical protein n=1 Tax=Actinomadura sp. NPDC048032 TaxID=3155747 RepID=UPI0033FC19F3
MRDALRRQVGEPIGSLSGVLVVDDTGFEKKGRRSGGSTPARRKDHQLSDRGFSR